MSLFTSAICCVSLDTSNFPLLVVINNSFNSTNRKSIHSSKSVRDNPGMPTLNLRLKSVSLSQGSKSGSIGYSLSLRATSSDQDSGLSDIPKSAYG